jgi:hypothetical protein
MPDPAVTEIVVRLRTHPTAKTAAEVRRDLNERFAKLNQDQAATLLEILLLRPDLFRTPHDFRVLNRHARTELLLTLVMKLGSQTRKEMNQRLTGRDADPTLTPGLKLAFPAGTEQLRAKLLKALDSGVATSTAPTITLILRTSGRPSDNNNCGAKEKMTDKLGPDPSNFRVWMEIRGLVKGHHPGAKYKFSRTIHGGDFYLEGLEWKKLHYWPKGTPDNERVELGQMEGYDEDREPDHDQIYVVDGPTPGKPPFWRYFANHDTPASFRECVREFNATEILEVKLGSNPWKHAAKMLWCAVSWVVKKDGVWQMDLDKSGIAKGGFINMGRMKNGGVEPYAVFEAVEALE